MNPQQNSGDSTGMIYAIVGVFAAALAFWYFASQILVIPVMWLRLMELHAILWVYSIWNDLMSMLGFAKANTTGLLELKGYVVSVLASPKSVSFKEFASANALVGSWTRYPVILILACLSYLVYKLSKVAMFRNVYSMKSIENAQVDTWPQIAPTVKLNLVKQDIDKGPWAMAQSTLLFCEKNKLIFPKEKIGHKVWGLHKAPATQIISMQIGPQIGDLNKLKIEVKALLVIFIARATRRRELSNKYISQISASASSGKLNFSGIREEFNKLKGERCLQWVLARHAYVYTIMGTMLEIARSDGVLASAEFLWLKPVDRRLWYMLNSVGRQTAVVEISGAFAHWLAEKKVGRPLKTPMVKQAVDALSAAVEDILYVEKGDSWHSREG